MWPAEPLRRRPAIAQARGDAGRETREGRSSICAHVCTCRLARPCRPLDELAGRGRAPLEHRPVHSRCLTARGRSTKAASCQRVCQHCRGCGPVRGRYLGATHPTLGPRGSQERAIGPHGVQRTPCGTECWARRRARGAASLQGTRVGARRGSCETPTTRAALRPRPGCGGASCGGVSHMTGHARMAPANSRA